MHPKQARALSNMVRHEETCDRAEEDDLCMFAPDHGKRTRAIERDSRNPCDMQQQPLLVPACRP